MLLILPLAYWYNTDLKALPGQLVTRN